MKTLDDSDITITKGEILITNGSGNNGSVGLWD